MLLNRPILPDINRCISLFFLCVVPLLSFGAVESEDNKGALSVEKSDHPENTVTVVGQGFKNEKMKNALDWYDKPYIKEVITQEKIEQENPADVKDAVRHIAGLNVTESGGFVKELSIRGLSGRRVGTLIDNAKVTNQGLTHNGSGEINSIDTANIAKIEIIKGSPAVIYDPGTAGGLINVVTKKSPTQDGVQVRQVFAYDEGYKKTKSATEVEGAFDGWGARASFAKQSAKDYKVAGDDKVQYAIQKSNFFAQMSDLPPITVGDLGYHTQQGALTLSKRIGDGVVDVGFDRWQGHDMAFIHGQALENAGAMLIYKKKRETKRIGYKKERMGVFSNLDVHFVQIDQTTQASKNSEPSTLRSRSVIASSDYLNGSWEIKNGLEFSRDEAVTGVYSDQDYWALYSNASWSTSSWHLHAGLRYNQWRTHQNLLEGVNAAVAADLVGISGKAPEKQVDESTWSMGAMYELTSNQSLGLNYSKTYRNPDLLERYAFSGTIGGGYDMMPESGRQMELVYKYLKNNVSLTASAFYNDFDQFIWTKTIRELKNPQGLQNCILLGLCDPLKGNYNDRESDFFSSYTKYYNAAKVINKGAELSLNYFYDHQELSGNLGFNKIESDDVFVQSAANPLKLNVAYKYHFENRRFKPWVKVALEKVWNKPTVNMHPPFKDYWVSHLYMGAKSQHVTFNLGIRNLNNKQYQAPYSVLNGLKRSAFASVSISF